MMPTVLKDVRIALFLMSLRRDCGHYAVNTLRPTVYSAIFGILTHYSHLNYCTLVGIALFEAAVRVTTRLQWVKTDCTVMMQYSILINYHIFLGCFR